MADIVLPYKWQPRHYQKPAWNYLSNGGTRAVLCYHRRAGKDDLCLHHTACAAHERPGSYWYLLPEYSQARKAMWNAINPHSGKRRIDDAFPPELRKKFLEQEMMIEFHNGSTFQLVGSDNFNSLVGSPPVGLVFSEYAISNPSAWAYLMPILEENGGWAVFNSTPRGKNHFKTLLEFAQKEEGWFADVRPASKTGVFSEKQLSNILKTLQAQYGDDFGYAMYMQEYFVSFDAAIPGSIWGDCVTKADMEGRITEVPVNPEYLVYTAWDLGRTDDTAIWFFQLINGSIHVVDYHASSLKEIEFYADFLRNWRAKYGIQYGTHFVPHDARPRRLGMGGKSILQQFQEHNVGRFVITANLDVQEGIQAARATFPQCRFDATRCADGIEALKQYHRSWDEEKQQFSTVPVHDWSSHACLVGGSLVLTSRGNIPISDIRVGDMVWTPAGYAPVDAAGPVKFADELMEIGFSNGSLVKATPEHVFLTNKGPIIASDLNIGDSIITEGDSFCNLILSYSTERNIGFRDAITDVTNGVMGGQVTSIGQYGNLFMEKFRKDTMFTILTATLSTIVLRILSYCRSLSTSQCTQGKALGLVVKKTKRSLQRLGSLLKIGILRRRAESGTQSTERELGLTGNGLSASALNAEENSQVHTPQEPNTATKIVSKRRLDVSSECPLVYDLTVRKHHCYTANGVLVSNSDAFRYLSLSWKHPKTKQELPPRDAMQGSINNISFGELKKQHFKRMQAQREGI